MSVVWLGELYGDLGRRMRPNSHRSGAAAAWIVQHVWQRRLGPIYARRTGTLCRFYPSCSEYGVTALRKHGIIRGAALVYSRVMRCVPSNCDTCIDMP